MHADVFVQLGKTIINTHSKRKKVKLVFRPKKRQSKTRRKECMMQLNISKVFWLKCVVITLQRTEKQEDITELLVNVDESINALMNLRFWARLFERRSTLIQD